MMQLQLRNSIRAASVASTALRLSRQFSEDDTNFSVAVARAGGHFRTRTYGLGFWVYSNCFAFARFSVWLRRLLST